METGHAPGVSGQVRAEDEGLIAKLASFLRRGRGREPAAAYDHVRELLEGFVAGLGGLMFPFEVIGDALGGIYLVAFEHTLDVFERRRVRGGEAAADGRGLVADDVGEQERHDVSGRGAPDEVATLQGRDVLTDGVDLTYLRPAPQECSIELFEIFEADIGGCVGQERRRPAGDEDQQEVPFLQALQEFLSSLGCLDAALVGLRMPGDDGLEGLGRFLVSALDHAQTTAQSFSQNFSGGPGHRPRGFAHRQHEDALRLEGLVSDLHAPALRAQETAHGLSRLRRRERGVQDLLEVSLHSP